MWLWAFGYFAAYAPYSALTKALTSGLIEGVPKLSGTALLPISVLASALGMYVMLTALGWWGYATPWQVGGLMLRRPRLLTLVSGACTSAIVLTTTLAYTFDGVSIVFAMLLMRGGVLVIAPFVDILVKRHVRWFSWLALALSVASLLAAFAGDGMRNDGCVKGMRRALDVACDNARQMVAILEHSLPHAVCPHCEGHGRAGTGGCPLCEGSGWLPEWRTPEGRARMLGVVGGPGDDESEEASGEDAG